MATKQTIAIIGAEGEVGSEIAKSLTKGPYRLLLMGQNAEELEALHGALAHISSNELEISNCPKEACWEADIIIFAVPYSKEEEIAPIIKQYTTGKVVLDIVIGKEMSTESLKCLQQLLPNSKVVTVQNADFSNPATGVIREVIIKGNDEEALQTVSEVLTAAGFTVAK